MWTTSWDNATLHRDHRRIRKQQTWTLDLMFDIVLAGFRCLLTASGYEGWSPLHGVLFSSLLSPRQCVRTCVCACVRARSACECVIHRCVSVWCLCQLVCVCVCQCVCIVCVLHVTVLFSTTCRSPWWYISYQLFLLKKLTCFLFSAKKDKPK